MSHKVMIGASIVMLLAAGATAGCSSDKAAVKSTPATTVATNADATSTTTAPATEVSVPAVGCANFDLTTQQNQAASGSGTAKVSSSVLNGEAGLARFTVADTDTDTDTGADPALGAPAALAPVAWQCQAYTNAVGQTDLYVYPASAEGSFAPTAEGGAASEDYTGQRVHVVQAGFGEGLGESCAVFAMEPVVTAASGSEACQLPEERGVTKGDEGEWRFVDARKTSGAGVMVMASAATDAADLNGAYAIVTCDSGADGGPTGPDQHTVKTSSLCQAVANDFLASRTGKVLAAG